MFLLNGVFGMMSLLWANLIKITEGLTGLTCVETKSSVPNLAPRCRLKWCWCRKWHQSRECPSFYFLRELGSERCKSVWSVSFVFGAFGNRKASTKGMCLLSQLRAFYLLGALGFSNAFLMLLEYKALAGNFGLSGFLMVWCLPVPALSLTSSWSPASTGQPFNTLDLTNGPRIGNAVWTLQTFLTHWALWSHAPPSEKQRSSTTLWVPKILGFCWLRVIVLYLAVSLSWPSWHQLAFVNWMLRIMKVQMNASCCLVSLQSVSLR